MCGSCRLPRMTSWPGMPRTGQSPTGPRPTGRFPAALVCAPVTICLPTAQRSWAKCCGTPNSRSRPPGTTRPRCMRRRKGCRNYRRTGCAPRLRASARPARRWLQGPRGLKQPPLPRPGQPPLTSNGCASSYYGNAVPESAAPSPRPRIRFRGSAVGTQLPLRPCFQEPAACPGGSNRRVRRSPAARPLAAATMASFRDASSIISPSSMAAPRRCTFV
jgi:hypothetical protein